MTWGRFSLAQSDYDDPPRPFLEHLLDLRTCLVRCAVAWVACVIAIAFVAPQITHWLMEPARQQQDMLQGLDWTTGFDVLLQIMLWGGTALSLPFLTFFILRFIFPGLKPSERTLIVFSLFASTALFAVGVWMAYAETLAIAFQVLQQINAWMGIPVEVIRIDGHIAIVIKTIMAFGLAFQLPLLLMLLGWIGVIPSEALAKNRRIAIVLIFILAMVLTPPDPVSQILMAVPMVVLFEACIWLIRAREAFRRKEIES